MKYLKEMIPKPFERNVFKKRFETKIQILQV